MNEQRMLIDAICTGLTDLYSDVKSDETESTLALAPQVVAIRTMADNLRNRIAKESQVKRPVEYGRWGANH